MKYVHVSHACRHAWARLSVHHMGACLCVLLAPRSEMGLLCMYIYTSINYSCDFVYFVACLHVHDECNHRLCPRKFGWEQKLKTGHFTQMNRAISIHKKCHSSLVPCSVLKFLIHLLVHHQVWQCQVQHNHLVLVLQPPTILLHLQNCWMSLNLIRRVNPESVIIM